MPRDGSGNYTLPAGNPVISGTTIDVVWANPTMADVAVALTDSLSRSGSGGMLVPFLNADGAIGSPGISWVNETTLGFYRAAAGEMRTVITGVDRTRWIADVNPFQVFVSATWRPVLNTFSPYTIIGDWTWEGRVVTDDSTVTRAGLNIPTGVAPTVPVEGDVWKTASQLFAFVNGVATGLGGSSIVGASTIGNSVLRGDGSGGWVEETDLIITTAGSLSTSGSITANDGVNNFSINTLGTTTSMFGTGGLNILDISIGNVKFGGSIFINELAASLVPVAGQGQIWMLNSVPNVPMFTDDTGIDFRISAVQWGENDGNTTTVNNSTALVNVAGLENFRFEAGGVYQIEIFMRVNQANAAADLQLRMTRQGAGTFLNEFFRITSVSDNGTFTFQDNNAHSVLNATQNVVGNHTVYITGTVSVGVSDLWDLQFAQQVAQGANTLVDDPSYMKVTRIA